jgi:hypothetical protein
MKVPFLKQLLRNDWISIENNIKIHDLGPVLSYIGQLGNPEFGGIELEDFIQRQKCYQDAEVAAMLDVPKFIQKAQTVYGYPPLVNDVGGSICELNDQKVIDTLVDNTLLLYIQVTDQEEENKLIERAKSAPKPLYYRPEFLQQQLAIYLHENKLDYAAQMHPDEFTCWIFPKLFHSRIPRYEAIAKPHGYTVTSQEVSQVRDQHDFLQLLELAISRV